MKNDVNEYCDKFVKEAKIWKYKENVFEETIDRVVEEDFLAIKINNRIIAELSCLLSHKEYLAIGFLFTEGFISDLSDLKNKRTRKNVFSAKLHKHISMKDKKPTYLSGCGKSFTFKSSSSFPDALNIDISLMHCFSAEKILRTLSEFLRSDSIHLATGGTHAAAMATEDEILFFAPDIGRHNAMQKVIGWAFSKKVSMHDKIIFSTGRISGEVVHYALAIGAPLIVSPSAPTNLAVNRAKNAGITLIGFARGKRLSIFSHPERVQV